MVTKKNPFTLNFLTNIITIDYDSINRKFRIRGLKRDYDKPDELGEFPDNKDDYDELEDTNRPDFDENGNRYHMVPCDIWISFEEMEIVCKSFAILKEKITNGDYIPYFSGEK